MTGLTITAGVLCLLYFIILFIKGVDFCMIWLPAGLFLLAFGGYMRYTQRHPFAPRIPGPAMTVLGIAVVCALAVFLAVEGMILHAMLKKPEKNLDYIIVLGAQVKGTVPSRALKLRLEAAEEYLRENPETMAILSGGQGDGEDITEAQCMYEYLAQHGIEKERLLMETASTSTKENLSFSRPLCRTGSVGILSNNFHVYRASLLARKLGYGNVSTVASKSDWRLQIHYLVREFFALVKEKITGNI